jgi:hypothetical protein
MSNVILTGLENSDGYALNNFTGTVHEVRNLAIPYMKSKNSIFLQLVF